MKYRLYRDIDNYNVEDNVLKIVLENRDIKDYKKYLSLDDGVILDYKLLDNINEAVEIFMSHFEKKSPIGILVDEDVDGFCSGAMMYLYIKEMDETYPVQYILHNKAKAHGLSNDVIIPENIKLLIIPDAGTNDVEQCKNLKQQNTDILILDHHEQEVNNDYAIIVNNQISNNYLNKDFCGAGIVYKFLQAVDDENWTEIADNYLDLCALANISDVMDMRSFETRYLTDLGLENIKNKFLKSLTKAQEYSTKGKINIHNVQWYLTPVINAMIRIGSQEEKELLFRAFIEQDEYFEYKKRATKDKSAETVQESIYDRAARLCKNVKSRQDKLKDKGVLKISEIVNNIADENKVVVVDSSDLLDSALTGVVAIKVAEMFNKPCILLNKHINENNKIVYGGSARNINHSPIDSFKDVVNSTNVVDARGHANAFGLIDLEINKKEDLLNKLNNILADVEYDSTYKVDFILDINDVTINLINEMSKFEDIIAQGIDEPVIAIENILLNRNDFEIIGRNEDAIAFMVNDIKYIQFKCKEGNSLYDWLNDTWNDEQEITFNIVGKPCINEYDGIRTPQVIIEDLDVIKTSLGGITETDDELEDW